MSVLTALLGPRTPVRGGYGHPSKNAPQWYTGYLTFQAGNPRLRPSSLTGSGFIYNHDNPGRFQPVIVLQTGPTTSLLGGGLVPSQVPFLTKLFQNPSGNNQGA